MKNVINSINADLHSWEPIDLSIRVDDAIMRATPMNNGKWYIVFKQGESLRGTCSATNKQLEKIAEAVLKECEDRNFINSIERDDLGYCVEHSYTAADTPSKRKRRRKTDVFRTISFA